MCFVQLLVHQVWDIDLIISKNSNHTNPTIAKKTAFAQLYSSYSYCENSLGTKEKEKKGGDVPLKQ